MTSPQQTANHPHALVFVAPSREQYREGLLSLSDIAHGLGASPPAVLAPWEAAMWTLPTIAPDTRALALAVGATYAIDVAVTPIEDQRKGLLLADMDSTIISCECLDELADFAGIKTEIAAITERAMRGELPFEAALIERVKKLAGLPTAMLQRCFDERVRLNPGAETLVRTMAAHGARCVLVSGGFTFFTERVARIAGFHAHVANVLLDDGATLSGAVATPILGREAKRARLESERAALGLRDSQTLAIGDGANDLDMIAAAGLGVAYHAKPIVAEQADAAIVHTGLETALFFQGYRRNDFVTTAH